MAKYRTRYKRDLYFRARCLLKVTAQRCKKSGMPYDLDPHWLALKFRGVCEVSGLAFDLTGEVRSRTPSIDRIQAGGGYTKDNCRVVLLCVNMAMGDWGLEELLTVAQAMVEKNR